MRYVLDKATGKLVEKQSLPPPCLAPNVIPDIQECRNMVEGGRLTSRSQIRELERRHGVRQIGNDWAGEVSRSEGHGRN